MAIILVSGAEPGAGASTVAAGIAHRAAYAGHRVALERLEGDERAAADAAAFARFEIAESSGAPISAESMTRDADVTVLEAPAAVDAAALATRLGASLVLVGPEGVSGPEGALVIENRAAETRSRRLAEDRVLAAPTVARLIEASRARVLARSDEGDDATCEHIVLGAISHDPDEPYFRRFSRPAVVTRAEKVDIVLAAMRTNPPCIILTGGGEPSPYILDRVASGRGTTLLLAAGGTAETMQAIQGTFGSVPFSGEAKLERVGRLSRSVIDDEALAEMGIRGGAAR